MVVALGPGRFYGSSLPRPRFFSDVKLNDDRVDPPVPVMDPLLSWANEAHWSMGGLSFKRHRLQGRIEGSIKKLRAHKERILRKRASPSSDLKPMIEKTRLAGKKPPNFSSLASDSSGSEGEEEKMNAVKAAPTRIGSVEKKRVRRLGEEFDRIAAEQLVKARDGVDGVASRTKSRKPVVEEGEIDEDADAGSISVNGGVGIKNKKEKTVDGGTPRRTSPRKKQST